MLIIIPDQPVCRKYRSTHSTNKRKKETKNAKMDPSTRQIEGNRAIDDGETIR